MGFFRHLFSKIEQNHPCIYLKGILHKDLLALMDYIYNGETKVGTDDLNRFIDAAEELKIKGLAKEVEILQMELLKNDKLECIEVKVSEQYLDTSKYEEQLGEAEAKIKPHNSSLDKSSIKEEGVELTIDETSVPETSFEG